MSGGGGEGLVLCLADDFYKLYSNSLTILLLSVTQNNYENKKKVLTAGRFEKSVAIHFLDILSCFSLLEFHFIRK